MARDRPSPYEEGGRFVKKMSGYRSAGACPPRSSCRRDLQVSIPRERPMARRRRVRPHHLCSSGSPDPDPFGSGCSRTTEVGTMPSITCPSPRGITTEPVVQDRLILTRSGAGAPELQRWTFLLHRDREVSPTRSYETPSLICN